MLLQKFEQCVGVCRWGQGGDTLMIHVYVHG